MQANDLSRALDRVAARNLVAACLLGIPGLFAAAAWLWHILDQRVLMASVGLGTVASVITWLGARHFLQTGSAQSFRVSQVGNFLISTSCAFIPLLGLSAQSTTEAQLKVALVSITILASGASANTASRTLMLLFSGPLAVGLSIGLLRSRAEPFLFLGIIVFLFIGDRSFRSTRSDTRRLLREKARADDLAAQLAEALATTELESLHDPLTGAGNRRMLERFSMAPHDGPRTVICIDLDNFKQLNDQHGHDVGDELLVEATQRITNVLRKEDTLIRSGGDEFVAIVNADLSVARDIATRILRAMCVAYPLTIGPATVGASIGLASVGPDGSIDAAQRRADQSMYRAKTTGRNRISEWDSGLEVAGKASTTSGTTSGTTSAATLAPAGDSR